MEPGLVKYGIWLVTNMVVQVLQKCFKMNNKVSHSGCLFNEVNPD